MRLRDSDIPDDLVPYFVGRTGAEDELVRWISKEIYTQIQCLVLLQQFQSRVDRAWTERRTDGAAERQITRLFRCTTQYDLEQWLQDYSGRAVLSCSLCGAVDVPLALEIKNPSCRTRLCHMCVDQLGGTYKLPPAESSPLFSVQLSLPCGK